MLVGAYRRFDFGIFFIDYVRLLFHWLVWFVPLNTIHDCLTVLFFPTAERRPSLSRVFDQNVVILHVKLAVDYGYP